MKMQKLALVVALAAVASVANAAENLDIDTGVTEIITDLAERTNGAYVNLSLNNVDSVNGSVNVALPAIGAFENSIETTAIGVVQSGSLEYQNAIVTTIDRTETKTDATVSTMTDNSTSVMDKSKTMGIDDSIAKTSSTSASKLSDTSSYTDTSNITTDIDKTVTNDIDNTITDATAGALASDVGVYNIAYNKAEIDGSINITQTDGTPDGGIASAIGGQSAKWTTTAIGSVQSGNIKVTVK